MLSAKSTTTLVQITITQVQVNYIFIKKAQLCTLCAIKNILFLVQTFKKNENYFVDLLFFSANYY